MPRAPTVAKTARRRPSAAGRGARAYLEPLCRILVAGGHTPDALAREFVSICRELPRRTARTAAPAALVDLPHVLSLWHADPAFVDDNGQPRALALTGPGSLAALVRRVFPRESPRTVIAALERAGALQRVGSKVLPMMRTLRFEPDLGVPHGLEALLGLLRTIDHNLSQLGDAPRVFERIARNPRVPVRLAAEFETEARRKLLALLVQLDAYLARLERLARSGERTVPIGVGAYMIVEPHARRRRR